MALLGVLAALVAFAGLAGADTAHAAKGAETSSTTVGAGIRVGPVGETGASAGRHRWRIAKRPDGARPVLKHRRSARPLLRARTPGTYVLRVRTKRARAANASYDRFRVAVTPLDPPIGVPVDTLEAGTGAITIGGRTFPSDGAVAYVLLERTTRDIAGAGSVQASEVGMRDLQALAERVGSTTKYMLLFSGLNGLRSSGGVNAFSDVLKRIGGAPIGDQERTSISQGGQFSVVGIPGAPQGAATVRVPTVGQTASGAIRGRLQRNVATERYDFVSTEHPSFDTRAQTGAATNTMRLDGKTYEASMSAVPGATAGLHFLVVDPLTLEVVTNEALVTNAQGSQFTDRQLQDGAAGHLRRWLDTTPGRATVFVQTIGHPTSTGGAEWSAFADQLGRLGANRLLVNSLDGTTEYALVGRLGSPLPPAEASTAHARITPNDPVPPPARLIGTLSRTRSSGFEPTVADPRGNVNTDMLEVAYQTPQEFPAVNAAANRWITLSLRLCTERDADGYCDMRVAYWNKFFGVDWDQIATDLANRTPFEAGHGFTKKDFDAAKAQFADEISKVNRVRAYFRDLREPFASSTAADYINLQAISEQVTADVKPPPDNSSTTWILGLVGKVASLGGFAPPPASSAAAGISASFALLAYLSDERGTPILGGQIQARARELSGEILRRTALAEQAMHGLTMLMLSDWGKLQAAYSRIGDTWEIPDPGSLKPKLQLASKQWFYEELTPIAYPYLLWTPGSTTNARDVTCPFRNGPAYGRENPWDRQPDSAQLSAAGSRYWFTRGAGQNNLPSDNLGKTLFNPTDASDTPGVGIEKLSFFDPRLFGNRLITVRPGANNCDVRWLPNSPPSPWWPG